MANFVKWRGPYLSQGSPSISHTIQSIEVGQAFKFGVWGGSGLKVGPNNPAIAQLNPRCAVEDSSNNITWYELVGLTGDSYVMIEARNPGDNAVWDYFQLAVKKRSKKLRPPIRGISYDYQVDATKIGPNYNASMILALKVGLVPVNGTGSPPQITDTNGVAFATAPWTDAGWKNWVGRFKRIIETKWSEKFWLASPDGLSELEVIDHSDSSRYRAHLHCVLRVEIVPVSSAHHRIPVVQATQTLPPGPVIVNSNTASFRSNSTLLDNQDLRTDAGIWPTLTSRPFNTATHEIGHLLGLFHPFQGNVAAGLPGNSVYCVVGNPDCSAVMGLGDVLLPSYAVPWQNAAAAWFNSEQKGYRLSASDFSPSIFRLAPASL